MVVDLFSCVFTVLAVAAFGSITGLLPVWARPDASDLWRFVIVGALGLPLSLALSKVLREGKTWAFALFISAAVGWPAAVVATEMIHGFGMEDVAGLLVWVVALYLILIRPFLGGRNWRAEHLRRDSSATGDFRPGIFSGNRRVQVTGLAVLRIAMYPLIFAASLVILDGLVFLSGQLEPGQQPALVNWIMAAVNLVGLGFLAWSRQKLGRKMKRLAALRFDQLPKTDNRQPNLLLRSFDDEDLWITENRHWWHTINRIFGWDCALRIEELVADAFWPTGPLIAIGRPGENLPVEGAVRDYVSDEHWQTRVKAMAAESRNIVMIAGKSQGVLWELRTLHEEGHVSRLTLLFPPVGTELATVNRWHDFRESSGLHQLPIGHLSEGGEPVLAIVFGDHSTTILTGAKRDELHYRAALETAAYLAVP